MHPEVAPVDWSAQRDEWLGYLDALYEKLEGFLGKYISSGQIQRHYQEIELNEEDIGAYKATKMILRIGRQTVTFLPIGTMMVGSKGRVDVRGPSGDGALILVDKKSIGIRSLFFGQPPVAPEWEWKIFPRPPETKFTPLNSDNFHEMIMEIAHG